MTLDDPALDTLMLPFEQNLLPWPQEQRVAVLRPWQQVLLERQHQGVQRGVVQGHAVGSGSGSPSLPAPGTRQACTHP